MQDITQGTKSFLEKTGCNGLKGCKPQNILVLFLVFILISGCSTAVKKERNENASFDMQQRTVEPQPAQTKTPQIEKPPEFTPVSEELSPLKTRIVSISARGTPLRDVLHVIAEATGLNLVMEKGVDPETPVTITLKNVTAEDALNTVFSSADYFYSIKENMLFVKAIDTRVFEFGQPAVIQEYSVEVGGDILGGETTGVTGTAGTTGGSFGASSIKGSVTQKIQADKDALKFWDSLEKSLANLIGKDPKTGFNINRMTGTIVVTASKNRLQTVEDYLRTIKKILNRQVIVEARIVEVQLSEGLKYGIDWTALNINNVGQVTFGTSKFTDVVGDLPSFQIGLSRWDFTGLLKALQTQGNIRVLSNPRVNIMNGQTALLSVGRNVNFISRVETTTSTATTAGTGTTTFTVQTSSVLSGIIIGIVPFISENGDVSMSITPIVSDLVKLEDKTVGKVGENMIQISLPTVDLRELSTTVKVKDGDIIVIGGLIQNRDSEIDTQVPFIGSVPIVGNLFKRRDSISEKTELIIMLRPKIIT